MTYLEILISLRQGKWSKARLPSWNDESYLTIRDSETVLVLDNRESGCRLHTAETLRTDWQMI